MHNGRTALVNMNSDVTKSKAVLLAGLSLHFVALLVHSLAHLFHKVFLDPYWTLFAAITYFVLPAFASYWIKKNKYNAGWLVSLLGLLPTASRFTLF
jgi:uncharacterized membrane protein YqjE